MALNDFFSMGGYGAYVWSSYGICAVVLLLNVIQPIIRERRTIRELQKRFSLAKENKSDKHS
jgi:heme exporter protein D